MFQYPQFKTTARFPSTSIPQHLYIPSSSVQSQILSPKSCRSEPNFHNRPMSQIQTKIFTTGDAWSNSPTTSNVQRVRRKFIFQSGNGNHEVQTERRNMPVIGNFRIINYGPIQMNCLNPSVRKCVTSPNKTPFQKYNNSVKHIQAKQNDKNQLNRYHNTDPLHTGIINNTILNKIQQQYTLVFKQKSLHKINNLNKEINNKNRKDKQNMSTSGLNINLDQTGITAIQYTDYKKMLNQQDSIAETSTMSEQQNNNNNNNRVNKSKYNNRILDDMSGYCNNNESFTLEQNNSKNSANRAKYSNNNVQKQVLWLRCACVLSIIVIIGLLLCQ